MVTPSVSVIITAYNAAATIGDAVRSALSQAETAQVIVVDDVSRDRTVQQAEEAAGGDPRLLVIRRARNGGPAAARNDGLDAVTGSVLAVLDADDFLLPGRFARLLALPDWDMVADNILFVSEETSPTTLPRVPPCNDQRVIDVDLADFVRGNLSTPGENRREWGFLKPLIRMDFLNRHRLRYRSDLRLGEDYDLYVRMLQQHARFRISMKVGYVARWRDGSLSARHSTADLAALCDAARGHLHPPGGSVEARHALRRQLAQLRQRYLVREILDRRAEQGRVRAVLGSLLRPTTLVPVARGVIADKLAARVPAPASRIGRLLLDD